MIVLLTTVLVASVLGSPHCAAMCGCFAVLAGGTSSRDRAASSRASVRRRLAAYHGARGIVYVALGTVAGMLGAALDAGGTWIGAQRIAAMIAGVSLLAIGLATLLRIVGVRGIPEVRGLIPRRVVAAAQRRAMRWTPSVRAGAIGALSVVLPCGWLYAFVLTAAGTGSALAGAAVLAAFWLGTVPILAALATVVRRIAAGSIAGVRLQWMRVATALCVIGIGFAMTFTRVGARDLYDDATELRVPDSIEAAVERAANLDATRMPCCHDDD